MNLSEEEFLKEKLHLESTTHLLRDTISNLAQDLYDNEEKLNEFKKYIWDTRSELDPSEMKSIISNNEQEIDSLEMKAKYYKKLYKIQNSPYFAKIIFKNDENINSNIYIGLTYLTKDNENVIYDWRAPISSIFYDYESGNCEYECPDGKIKGYLENKRQFTIEESKIIRVFDSKLNVQDDLLQEVLSQKNNDYMKNIVNTIQQEQNAIIRNVKDRNLIVQGIAGSGKTSVALHRIAFLLYKIKNLTSDKILIFAPNKVFSEYISNVLPELGEENTQETTFSDFLETYITEYKHIESFTSFIERYYKYEEDTDLIKFKQSNEIIKIIDLYIKNYTKKARFKEDILNKDLYITKDKLNYYLNERYNSLPLLERINEIAEKLSEQNFKSNKTKTKQIKNWLKEKINISLDIKEIYINFYSSLEFKLAYKKTINDSYLDKLNKKTINYEDSCLLVYMKSILMFLGNDYQIEQTIIDEAQDYNKLQYILLKKILKKSKFTILGDINQTINPYYQYNSLEELKEIFDNNANYLELTKTYRSSPEIIEHTNKILNLNLISAIRRDTKIPVIFKEEENLKEQLLKDIENLQKNNKSIAIITKTDTEANTVYKLLKPTLKDLTLISSESNNFNRKLIVIPSYMSKGLEFDASIVYTNKENKYSHEERYLYYVSCTRSQYYLIIYNQN